MSKWKSQNRGAWKPYRPNEARICDPFAGLKFVKVGEGKSGVRKKRNEDL